MKVRKRVTLMVITVSSIFGISWGTSSVSYVLKHFTSQNIGNVAITNTMAVFNSAVNPFVYALFNQQFREKVKGLMCCTFRSASRIVATRESENTECPNTINWTIHLQKERSHVLRSEDCKVYLSASTCKFDILYMKSETAVLVQSCVYLQSPCMFVWRAPYRRRDMHNGPNLRPNLVQVRALLELSLWGDTNPFQWPYPPMTMCINRHWRI